MQLELNPLNWNWNQFAAAGKHVVSFAAGSVAFAVAAHFISPSQGTDITDNINHVVNGIQELAKGISGLVATGAFIYASLKSATNASPKSQLNSVVTNLSAPELTQVANAVADPEGRNKLINAVATMPEVQKIVATENVALSTPSSKVVSQ